MLDSEEEDSDYVQGTRVVAHASRVRCPLRKMVDVFKNGTLVHTAVDL